MLSVNVVGLISGLLLASSPARAAPSTNYLKWKTFKANGVNLGGWLHQEAPIDPVFWSKYGGNTTDEWDFCVRLGSQCGPVLEERYATFITTSDIDKLAGAGINLLRVTTGYNAWVKVPGSQLYTGNQAHFLKTISTYAISKYGMHVIVDLHSLPGGVNGLDIGEKNGNYGWFQNETALDYSYQAVEALLEFIQSADHPQGYSLAPINEPRDNPDFSVFGTPAALSDAGAAWVLKYFRGVVQRAAAADARIPVVLQDAFKGEAFWAPSFPACANIAFDAHQYFFDGRQPTTSANLPAWLCTDAQAKAGDGKFPVLVGEWALQASANNTLASRAANLNTGLAAWAQYTRGSAYWNYKFLGTTPVSGQGTMGDYWNYSSFIDDGFINPSSAVICS